jgi:flotillin
MDVEVAQQSAQSASGQKQAERDQRIEVAKHEAEGVSGEANAQRAQEVAVAEQAALTAEGKKKAEAHQRIEIAEFEAAAVKGENESKAKIADYEAGLAERQAQAKRRGEVALAESSRDVLIAEKEEEIARLEKREVAQQIVERRKVEIDADAEAERLRRVAAGEADAILARYNAEAEGIRKVLEGKAKGYEQLMLVCGERKDLAPALLIVEQLPQLVSEQVKAIQNLKIDKITVWDSGANGATGTGSTAGFLKGMIGALPPVHELARQAGIDLPDVLGRVAETDQEAETESAAQEAQAPPAAES